MNDEFHQYPRLRRIAFWLGDLVFLAAVGAVSTSSMHVTHEFGWPFSLAMIVGMVIAMVLQIFMAFCVSPLLGSIESMTPSMVVGMLSPMGVCLMHMMDCELSLGAAAMLGAAFGTVMFAFVQRYSVQCRRKLKAAESGDQR